MEYRKKPVVVKAKQLKESNVKEIVEFIEGEEIKTESRMEQEKFEEYKDLVIRKGLKIKTLEGIMTASIGDYIIQGIDGEFYPCKPNIFHKTYEEV